MTSEIHGREAASLLEDLTAIVAQASAMLSSLTVEGLERRFKDDKSPVTAADEASEAIIVEGLARLLPGVPVIAEEMAERTKLPPPGEIFVLVDPLDGTKEFIAGTDQYTVNLAIVTHRAPILGIIAAPKQGKVWRGIVGQKAERLQLLPDGATDAQPIHARSWPAHNAIATVSRSHLDPATEAFLNRLEPLIRLPSGSAIKFCQLAEGTADVYPRLSTVCEWDVAAGHALLESAGGVVSTPEGAPLTYGHADKNFRVSSFIAWGDPVKSASGRI